MFLNTKTDRFIPTDENIVFFFTYVHSKRCSSFRNRVVPLYTEFLRVYLVHIWIKADVLRTSPGAALLTLQALQSRFGDKLLGILSGLSPGRDCSPNTPVSGGENTWKCHCRLRKYLGLAKGSSLPHRAAPAFAVLQYYY